MKKFNKVLMILAMVLLVASPVFASGITAGNPTNLGGKAIGGVTTVTGNIWKTIQVVVQVLAIVAIVFAGVRYMFASADQKADIKKQTVILIVGAVLVFAAGPIASFVAKMGSGLFTGV